MAAAARAGAGRRGARRWSGSTTAGCRRSRWRAQLVADGPDRRRSGTSARSTCRTGSSTREFPLVVAAADRSEAGSGALGDIGAHIVDLTQYVTGQRITGVSALTRDVRQGAAAAAAPSARGCPRPPAGSRARARSPSTTRRVFLGPARRRRAGDVRGHPVRHRPQERDPGRDQRLAGSLAFDFERHERAGVLRRHRGPDDRRASAGSWSPSPATRTCPAWWPPGHTARLRARVHPPDRRPRRPPSPPGPTRHRPSPTGCRCSASWTRSSPAADDALLDGSGGTVSDSTPLDQGRQVHLRAVDRRLAGRRRRSARPSAHALDPVDAVHQLAELGAAGSPSTTTT